MSADLRLNVIITGGSSGIGLATARLYAARGHNVAIIGRSADKLATAQAELLVIARAEGQRVAVRRADCADFEQATAAIDSLVADGLAPDILVNSAGVIIPGEFATMPLENFEVNLTNGYWSVVYPCRAAVPHMLARGSGHIVNVSSVAGYLGIYGYTGYSSAKFAVMGFSEALRFEMKPEGISVHVVCPPDTDTPALAFERTLGPPKQSHRGQHQAHPRCKGGCGHCPGRGSQQVPHHPRHAFGVLLPAQGAVARAVLRHRRRRRGQVTQVEGLGPPRAAFRHSPSESGALGTTFALLNAEADSLPRGAARW